MSQVRQPQNAFSSGEISPLLYGRNDYQRFQTGLRSARGFVPLREGGFTRAPGTIFRGYTKNNAPARLIRFQFSDNDALTLEFTDSLMRVWRYGALVEVTGSPGVVYELVTPFGAGDLANLQAVQSADVIYLVDGTRPIQKLSRFALDNWTIADLNLDTGPFQIQNLAKTQTMKATGTTGSISMSSNYDFFTASDVGALMQLEGSDLSSIPIWMGNVTLTGGTQMRYGGNIYQLGGSGSQNTGLSPPVHTEGTETTDISNNTSWQFISDGIGVVRITGIINLRLASAEVLKTVPKSCVTKATYRFSEGAWSAKYGYPAAIEIYEQSLYAAHTPQEPRTFWASTLGDYRDFEPSTEADGSFGFTIDGSETQNSIRWLRRGRKGIYIGALGEVYRGFSSDRGQRAGPTTFDTDLESTEGTNGTRPIIPYGFPIFPTQGGKRITELRYSYEQDGGVPLELSAPSSHLGDAGFEEIVWQSSPQKLAYARRGNGDIAVLIYDPQEDVLGWSVIPLAGGFVESLAVTASADGSDDILTMAVKRTVNGSTVRMIEEQALFFGLRSSAQPISEALHFFAASVFVQSPATDSFSVPHLAGEDVYAWTDQGEFGPITVPAGGAITLPNTVGRATIGLFDATHFAETLDLQALARDGDARGRPERLYPGSGVLLHSTAAGFAQAVERNFGQTDIVGAKEALVPLPVAADLVSSFSGTAELNIPTGHAAEVTLRFTPQGGAPMTVLAVVAVIDEVGP